MFLIAQSLRKWLWDNYPDLLPRVMLGHTETLTFEMLREYAAWCRTDEGKKHLKGGSEYRDDEYNRKVETAMKDIEDTNKNLNRCICCGDIIPEGRQVCPICKAKEV